MKKLMIAVLATMLLSWQWSAYAADMKIGVLNLQKLMQEAPQVQAVRAKLEKRFKPRQEALEKKAKALQSDMEKLRRDGSTMNASDREDLQNKITKERRSVAQEQQDLQSDAGLAQNQEMQSFLKQVNDKLQTVAKKEGYQLILQKEGVPYASDNIDVTEKVVAMLK